MYAIGVPLVYFPPENYICPDCEFQFLWSIHHDPLHIQEPYCPQCYVEFINDNVAKGVLKDDL